jgi:endonuclease YncB( thermonuclease family)
MHTVHIRTTRDHAPAWPYLFALFTAGAVLAIPTPVAAEAQKISHPLHPVSPAIHGLMAQPRGAAPTPRLAPPASDRTPARRRAPARPQLHRPPQHPGQARREAALARRWIIARLLAQDRPQKPRLLESWQIRTIDGDTFAVGPERFRLRGLDAPETTEIGGFGATQRLDLLLHEGPVLVIPYGQDSYGRTLAEVYVNNRNVADVMKEEGHAKPQP